jgi:ribose transport system substrate-binding protein
MMLRRMLVVLSACAIAFVGGCGERRGPDRPSAPAPKTVAAEKVTAAKLESVRKAGKPYKLALVVKTRNNPFFDPMIKAAEAQAKVLGVALEVQAPPQESDKELQFSMVENLAAKGVDAILIAPADSKGIVPALRRAADRGILVINIDNRVDGAAASASGLVLGGYVGADNEEGGRLAGKAMLGYLGGQGKVAILEGIRGADNAEARKRGFESVVSGALTIAAKDTAEWDTQKGYAKFQSMLAAHPDIKGLFCANDKMALGAMKAIEESGRKGSVTVIGYDNIPEVRVYLDAGEMKATIEQHPDLMGRYGVLMAVGVLDGAVAREREFLVPLEVITR